MTDGSIVMRCRCRGVISILLVLLGAVAQIDTALCASAPAAIAAAVASAGRPMQDIERDPDRRPEATLTFAGVRPGDKVLELLPGRGYYTRILSKVVGPNGEVYAFAPGPPRPSPGAVPAGATAPPNPIAEVYRLSRAKEFANVFPIEAVNARSFGTFIGLPEQVDVAWTSDNYHDFHNKALALDVNAFNKAVFRDLKPGGVYLILDYASAPGVGTSQTESLHRIDPETVKQEVTAAGFVLDAQSSVLSNAADDHTMPSRALVGKADQFLLRFIKPKSAGTVTKRPTDSDMKLYFGNTFIVAGTPTQRAGVIFYNADHTYQEFRADLMNGIWYLDADGNNCMVHQAAPAGQEGTVACRPMVRYTAVGQTLPQAVDNGTDEVSLVAGHVYPNIASQPPIGAPITPPQPRADVH